VFYGTSTQDRSICANLPGGLLAQAFEDRLIYMLFVFSSRKFYFYSFYVRVSTMTANIDGRSQIKVHTDERTQVHSAQSSLTVTHPSTNRGRRCITSVNVPLR